MIKFIQSVFLCSAMHLSPDGVEKLELGPASVCPLVGEKNSRPAHTEQRVLLVKFPNAAGNKKAATQIISLTTQEKQRYAKCATPTETSYAVGQEGKPTSPRHAPAKARSTRCTGIKDCLHGSPTETSYASRRVDKYALKTHLQQHGAFVPVVEVLRQVLRRYHQRQSTFLGLQQILQRASSFEAAKLFMSFSSTFLWACKQN